MTKNKLALLTVLLLAAVIAAAVMYSRNLRKQIDEVNARIAAENASAPAVPAGSLEGIGGMSINGMEIVQGENGRELWRLVAQSALMSEQGGDIVAQKPYLTYYLDAETAQPGAGRGTVIVESDEGDINQRENILRFIDNVVATHDNDVLTTSLIIYMGEADRLNCPEESFIESSGMRGKAREMSWHLDDNTLHAWGGVSIDFDTKRTARSVPGGADL